MAETKKPLLDLDTLIQRPTITINGNSYEIPSPDELSIAECQKFTIWGREIETLSKDEDAGDKLDELIGKVAAFVLREIPAEIQAKLKPIHKMQVVSVFTRLLSGQMMATAGAEAANRSTGAKSSPASSASSADRPAGGSTKPRRRS